MPTVTVTVTTGDEDRPRVSLVPRLGPMREQSLPPNPTPQFRRPFHCKKDVLMAFTMTDSQQVDVTIAPKDKRGNPAALDGVPEWSTDNSDVLALSPSADGMTCTISAVGPLTAPGSPALVTVKGDADVGAGVVPIIGTLEVEITGGAATTIAITPGTPAEQP